MSAETKGVERVIEAPRRPVTRVVFGEEAIFAPKAEVSISLLAGVGVAPLRADEPRDSAADTLLLDSISIQADRRAERFPQSATAWMQAGFARLAAGANAEARDRFERAVSIDDSSRTARLGLARAHSQLGNSERAIEMLARLHQEHPHDTEVLVSLAIVVSRSSSLEAALALLHADPVPTSDAAMHFAARGSIRIAMGDHAGAIGDIRKALRLRPDWPHARNALGIAELLSGNARAAERRFREAMRVAPLYEEPLLNLMRVLLAERRYEELLRMAAARYTERTAASGVAARLIGQAALSEARWALAREWIEIGVEKTSQPEARSRLLNDLGVTFSRLGRHTQATDAFRKSFQTHPSDLALVNCAKSLLDAGDARAAIAWLAEEGNRVAQQNEERSLVLATAFGKARLHSEAAEVYLWLVGEGSTNPLVYANLAVSLTDHLQRVDEAIAFARTGLEHNPSSPVLVNNLAYALLMAERVEEAERVLSNPVLAASDADRVCLTATRGLLDLKRGDAGSGRRRYDEALAMSQSAGLREVVKAKRDLELGRALLQSGSSVSDAAELLERAANAGDAAYPYSFHAREELRRLTR